MGLADNAGQGKNIMATTDYKVKPAKLEWLITTLTKINKRAAKLGIPGVQWTVGPLQTKVISGPADSDGASLIEREARKVEVWHDFTLTTEVVKLAGWTFVATLDHTSEAGVILRIVPGDTIPTSYREATAVCDHCGFDRRRNETFVVRHDDGTLKQVGRQCLRDFLGVDPTKAARNAEFNMIAAEACESEFDGMGGGSNDFVATEDFMIASATAIRVFGWRSRKTAREFGKSATADDAMMILFPGRPDTRTQAEKDSVKATEADIAQAKAAIEWARSLRNGHELSDYEHNVVVVASGEVLSRKSTGIAASIIPAFARATEQEINRRKAAAVSDHVGTVGTRETFKGLTVASERTWANNFGTTHLYTFVDAVGNRIKWFASSDQHLNQDDVIDLKATVKEHGDYKGIKETTVTRAKVQATAPAAPAAEDSMGDDSFLTNGK
jgi:hypothetical protein